METVNAMGLTCPVPVIETKKAILRLPKQGGAVKVLVDNAIACQNLSKMSAEMGYECKVTKQADREYCVIITVGKGHTVTDNPPNLSLGLVVAIGQDKMGSGDNDLGKILIKGFIYSLANLQVAPKAVLFFNGGVKLTLNGCNTLDDLNVLKQRGTQIFVCGTCVDFYGCKNEVAVGEITNMYNIVEQLRLAQSVINI